ncbi:MAG: hypothetical protein WC836_02500 [Desulfobacula sp.]|jgi:hypothetical protein
MNSPSIEFDRIKEDSPLPKIVRKSFRVPVDDKQNIRVLINDKPYPLQDIGLDGIGITAKDNLAFFVDQPLSNCELTCFDVVVKNLNGRIVHVSAALDQDWKYGIQWKGLEKDKSDLISDIVHKLKEQLLANDKNSSDDI